jgi:hypothetical protein
MNENDEFARVAEDALELLADLFKCYEGALWLARPGAVKDTLRGQAQALREQYEALHQHYQELRMKPESLPG